MKMNTEMSTLKIDNDTYIRLANPQDTAMLALLGRITFKESHGHYVEDKTNLQAYLDKAFSVATTKEELENTDNIYYILYRGDFPVGYAKLIQHATIEFVASKNSCRLERIYILDEFVNHKYGSELFKVVLEKAQELNFDVMWLSVYIKNTRAIHFYERNQFENVGSISFQVGKKGYENPILAKQL